jgi:superoxide dismutase, Cu-Zn family
MMDFYKYICVILIIIILVVAMCNSTIRNELMCMWQGYPPITAIAAFRNSRDSPGITGTVIFRETLSGTQIDVDLEGVPEGEHGFHIHKAGDLSEGCKSACDHFNPTGVDHGDIEYGHVGDMGNLTSERTRVKTTLHSSQIQLRGPNSVIGRSVVLHADRDDLGQGGDKESKKTGNSGARIACAVIGIKQC